MPARSVRSVLRRTLGSLLALVTLACGRNSPPPPGVAPGPPVDIVGIERLAWTQEASDSVQLGIYRYAIYIDGVRSELAPVSCQPVSKTSSAFDCSAPLPPMSGGLHTLELATFVVDGGVRESARSAPLQVNKTGGLAGPTAPGPGGPPAWWSRTSLGTADGVRLRLNPVASGVDRPTDLVFLPDRRILIAEEAGTVRVLSPDRALLTAPALALHDPLSGPARLLALAADPDFARTRFVYAIYSQLSPAGYVSRLARFREASNTLVDGVVLLDGVPALPDSTASLRVNAEGRLFAAFDDGGDPRRAGDLASPNGKILRLDADGTTPDDQAAFTPMWASDVRSPRGFDWHPTSQVLWIADQTAADSATVTALSDPPTGPKRGVPLASYALPQSTMPSSVAFYRGPLLPQFQNNLLIASESGRHLLRIRFDPAMPAKAIATERLLQDTIGGLRVVAAAPDGSIYVATSDAIATIVPAAR